MDSRGRLALAEWLASGHSQTELATMLGHSQPLVAQWLAGTVRPSSADREVLARMGICAVGDWLTPEERVRVNELTTKVG